MQTIGEESKDISFEQFCTLLNETRNMNPSRFSSFLGRRNMSEAVQFFKLLEDEGEVIIEDAEDEEDTEQKPVDVKP